MSDRHSRHQLFDGIGPAGQVRLDKARLAVVGCGAVGSHTAELLARAGAGRQGLLRIIDRDYVDESNLQRQGLFDETDAREHRPKAVAAAEKLRTIDSEGRFEPVVRDFNPSNAVRLISDVDLILDGTDNFRTRFVINDAAVETGKAWIYAGAVGSRGIVSFIIPGITPCLRCYLEHLPPLGSFDSCDTSGIITPLPAMVAALQVALAMRWLTGSKNFSSGITSFDLWSDRYSRQLESVAPNPQCRSCGTRENPALREKEEIAVLCGRNSVQLFTEAGADLSSTAQKIESSGRKLRKHRESVTAEIDEGLLTVFEDGRVIVEGTTDPLQARSILARYLGG